MTHQGSVPQSACLPCLRSLSALLFTMNRMVFGHWLPLTTEKGALVLLGRSRADSRKRRIDARSGWVSRCIFPVLKVLSWSLKCYA